MLQVAKAQSRGHLRDLRDGLAFVLTSRPLRAVLVAWTLALPAVAAINTTEVFLAKDSLNAGDFGYGLMFGSIGLGLAVGGFGAGTVVERRPIAVVYGGAIMLNALAFGLAAIAPNIWVAAACCALGGIGNGGAVLCNSLLVQRGAPDEVRGRAFTVIMAINYLAFAGGFLAGGLFDDRVDARDARGGCARGRQACARARDLARRERRRARIRRHPRPVSRHRSRVRDRRHRTTRRRQVVPHLGSRAPRARRPRR